MPIGYGSRFELPKISSNEFGKVAEFSFHKEGFFESLYGLVSTVITLTEAGADLVTADAFSAPIAAIGAVAQTGAEYVFTGEVTSKSLAFNFSSALIPLVSLARQGVKGVQLAKNSESLLSQLSSDIGKDISHFKDVKTDIWGRLGNVGVTNVSGSGLGEVVAGLESGTIFRLNDLESAQNKISSLLGSRTLKANDLINTLNKAGKIGSVGGSTARTLDEINKIQKIYKRVGQINSAAEEINSLQGNIEKKLLKIGATEDEIAKLFLKAKTSPFSIRRLLKEIFGNSDLTELELERLIASSKHSIDSYINLTKKEFLLSTKTKIISKTSKSINMMMSPTALASELVSKSVAKISAKMEEYGAKVGSFIKKVLKKGTKTVKQLEDEFIKTGGTLMNSSWIMGYKLLKQELLTSTILIQFSLAGTKSKSGINIKGKQPVIVTLSNNEIKNFIESSSKGQWYLNNVAKSRGGRHPSELGFGEEMANWLGFLPVDSINEVVGFYSLGNSFTKNIKSGVGTFIWQPKEYAAQAGIAFIKATVQEGVKSSIAISGVSNQYIKQALEGTMSGVVNHQSAKSSVTSSFTSSLSSYTDATFEDGKNGRGQIIKQNKKIQGGISGFKGITG